jgi:hypothetical protein
VGDDVILTEPNVDLRLEDLHPLSGDLRTAQPTDSSSSAAEHAARDDLDQP